MPTQRFKSFFKDYSTNVDQADNQYFWKLSDDIIQSIIEKNIGNQINKNTTILDAGGGTGRWILKFSKKYQCNFILYDLSTSMLEVAKNKDSIKKLGDKIRIVNGDLENMSAIKDASIDYVTSIYNPISFVKNVEKVFSEFNRILKKDGLIMVMGQGYYNALYSKINNYVADTKELEELLGKSLVSWNKSVPKLKVFTKETLEKLATSNNLYPVKTYGIPIFAQPQFEDFDSENKQKSPLSNKLEIDNKFYKAVFEIEMAFNSQDSVVNRGMNLMIVAKKK
ncbi:MAG: Demethylmenaquinone methyltransferase [Candidatus Shapirobacteria bacterium GW2011_GWE1_38_10]|uniref:Demethylmenaquinone methyltransferase n=1 Tax=Candidatus Shapirobacteria bacterium GW2011_GWE1_38_10 TaxID=1618488 RepID=A0A0G0LCA2_9BACT|nr:MAG: Demethylmenaquinone methyltransferase [Candidatus Shapirobacteria bacterium GW2011_GWF2_37_20]KKQ50271.1 MAG: Demethylmenaquinone methyltransferase [Candidatus Shapirobacteria bacterium GW2011_GWE1_38_10]KKQ64805.1 MAG: Demethylmenaquinone methyltransferase [Candidatus Shapirobacteria bacterium GW2011_GWF1_38_23]